MQITRFFKDGDEYAKIDDLPPIKVLPKLEDQDDPYVILTVRKEDIDPAVPSSVRLCVACGNEVWVSNVVLGEISKVKYRIVCLQCSVAMMGEAT